MSFIDDVLLQLGSSLLGKSKLNEIIINRIIGRSRTRPHPWSTRYPYICWSGLTDRSYNSRLLPPNPYPAGEALGSRRPPLPETAALFTTPPGSQRACGKSTVLFPAFAQYLTDGFIRTRIFNDETKDERKRTTSNHDIDISPLYGRTEAQTAVLRESNNPARKGRLKTQTIKGEDYPPFLFDPAGKVAADFLDAAGNPVLDEPLGIGNASPEAKAKLFAVGGDRANATPQVSMMNVVFLREHNRLAGLLEHYHPEWDDERVFQIARNITIVMFIKIVVEEYINHINTSKFRFIAEGKVAWNANWNRPNWMTAEFSLLYRWHSLVPENLVWNKQTIPAVTLLLDNRRLIELGLANAFVNVSANNASCLGLENSASFLWKAEVMAVDQGRLNDIDGYNQYRRAMGMKPKTSFEDVVGTSKDPKEAARRKALAGKLRTLYGTVDNVEFYVGLFAEPVEKNGPLPELIQGMVAMDAFSQALTNPLLSQHIWGNDANRDSAFTAQGLAEIERTRSLRDILDRNTQQGPPVGNRFVGMTRQAGNTADISLSPGRRCASQKDKCKLEARLSRASGDRN